VRADKDLLLETVGITDYYINQI